MMLETPQAVKVRMARLDVEKVSIIIMAHLWVSYLLGPDDGRSTPVFSIQFQCKQDKPVALYQLGHALVG